MKRKIRIAVAALAMMLCMQGAAFAAETSNSNINVKETNNVSTWVQPRGMYLQAGGCSIKASGSNKVIVNGYTDAYEDSSEVRVQLTVYKEISNGVWKSVWTDTYVEYDTDYAWFPSTTVKVDSGYYYMVEAKHTVKNNGYNESNYSETKGLYVG